MKKRRVIKILALFGLIAFGVVIYILADYSSTEIELTSLDEIEFELESSSIQNTIQTPRVETDASPSEIQPEPEEIANDPDANDLKSGSVSEEIEVLPPPFMYEARLTMVADGKVFGEEQFRLSRDESGAFRLVSSGFFQFKVVLVMTKLKFQQALGWDQVLEPDSLAFRLEGPLGVGNRDFDIQFEPEEPYRTGRMRVGEAHEDFRLPDGELFVQGTFSSFAIIPYILGDRSEADVQLILANTFGPTNSPGATANEIVLRHLGTARIWDSSTELSVEEYLLASSEDDEADNNQSLRILFAENQLVGIYATSNDEDARPFRIYREELFPDGFEIESEY